MGGGTPHRLTRDQVEAIRVLLAARTRDDRGHLRPTQAEIAARYGVSQPTISAIANGRYYRDAQPAQPAPPATGPRGLPTSLPPAWPKRPCLGCGRTFRPRDLRQKRCAPGCRRVGAS